MLFVIMPMVFMLIVVAINVVNHSSQGALTEGEISTVDLLVLNCFDPLVLIIRTLLPFL